jgi:hypothetical protein
VGDTHSPDRRGLSTSVLPRERVPGAYPWPIRAEPQRFQRPELSRPVSVLTPSDPRILVSPRREERAHGQRPMRRRGAIERDWAGGGYSSVSGAFHRWEARPPSASSGDKARDLPIGPRPCRPVSPERGRDRVRLSLNRAAHRTLANNERAERSASSKRYLSNNSGRRPALRVPFHTFSERSREAANTCPHLAASPPVRPPLGGGALFPLRGKTTAKRSMGGKRSPPQPVSRAVAPAPASRRAGFRRPGLRARRPGQDVADRVVGPGPAARSRRRGSGWPSGAAGPRP